MQSWLIMRWYQQGPVTNQLLSRTVMICRPILLYHMTERMHIKLPLFKYIIFSFPPLSVSTVLISSVILDGDLTAPQCRTGIRRWRITLFCSSTLLFLLPLTFMLSCFSWITTGKESGSPYDVLGASLALCGTIISSLNWSPRCLLTKLLLLVIIEALIVFRNGQKNMVLHATPSPRAWETATGFPFTTRGVL